MAALDDVITKLDSAWKVLDQRWCDLNSYWSDAPRRAFENDYWLPLEKQVAATHDDMRRLADIIAKAKHDVNSLPHRA